MHGSESTQPNERWRELAAETSILFRLYENFLIANFHNLQNLIFFGKNTDAL